MSRPRPFRRTLLGDLRGNLRPVPALLLLVLAAAVAMAPAVAGDEMAVRAAEGQRYRAMVQGDLVALEGFLDDDLVYTHSHGGVDDKASFLEGLRSGAVVYRKIQLGSSRVESWGDAAVITGVAVLEVDAQGERITAPVRFTAVYRRGADFHWRLLAWQTTPSGDVERRPLEAANDPAEAGGQPADPPAEEPGAAPTAKGETPGNQHR